MRRPADARGLRGLLLSAFGLGFLTRAPGTVASVATALLLYALSRTSLDVAAQAGLAGLLALVFGAFCLLWSGRVVGPDGRGDPGWVVADEVAGQALASMGALVLGGGLLPHAVALGAFRLLDIWKPGPVGAAEKRPGGVGVLADDLVAGLFAGLLAAAVSLL